MRSLNSSVTMLISSLTLFGCASRGGFSPQSRKFPIDGKVSTVSRADLKAAVVAANADRIYAVHVLNRNHIRVDISDDLHKVGNYDEHGRYFIERFHGNPMYVDVTRRGPRWEGDGAVITTY